MRIEQLWQELEGSVGQAFQPAGSGDFPVAKSGTGKCRQPADKNVCPTAGWVLRLARPDPACALHVGVELATGRRGLLLRVQRHLIPARRAWPVCGGLEALATSFGESEALFGVALKAAQQTDVFTALGEDLARRVTDAATPAARVAALLGGLSRWQKFLAVASEGLTAEQQRGLYGELHVLRSDLLPALGAAKAVNGWTAPGAAHQDFQFGTGAVEVKTTTAKQPQSVRITSERQLDDTGIAALFLQVVVLDERDVDMARGGEGESLPSLVEVLRRRLKEQPGVLELFNDRLLEDGYLDAHAPRYEGRQFCLRREMTFRVGRGFPRLVERDLPEGVGDVSYALSLAACKGFSVLPGEMVARLADSEPVGNEGKRRGHARP